VTKGEVHREVRTETPVSAGGALMLDACAELARELAPGGANAVGIGLCEFVDLTGRPTSAFTVDWRQLDVAGAFAGAHVCIESDVRAAANLTGRTFFVEFDLSGTSEADLVPTLTADWHYLVDTMKLTDDSRYLREGGLPVVGIFGFYEERFSAATASAILDVFQSNGPYRAFVAGAGAFLAHAAAVVIKRIVKRERPDHPSIAVNVGTPSRLSFPSAHATSTTAAAILLGRATGLPLPVVLVPPMALSRLVLGVHYPSDVLTGVAVGTVVATVVGAVADRAEGEDA